MEHHGYPKMYDKKVGYGDPGLGLDRYWGQNAV